MKKQLVPTLVAGIILFIWQFLSWAQLNVHGSEMQYTDKQDAIMEVLSQNLQPGNYVLPQPAPGTSKEQQEEFMKNSTGKPWATVSFHASYNANMGMNMFRGFVVDLISAFLLVWLLLKMQNLDFKTALLSSLAVGFISYLTIPYLSSVWFEVGSMGYLIDTIAQWGLVGLWLGWWLTRR
jgi:hypothetical protein